ncbi:MAG: hypothetical protein M3P18_14260, partial [Actinomycetota bacterium]|nr:hypothetical protein [Actinomycetota bacterium]
MLFSLLYMVLRFVLRLAPAGEARDREAEILVLRHQLKILQRKAPRPKLSRLDKLFLASASRMLAKGAVVEFPGHPSDFAPLASGTGPSQVDLQAEANGPAASQSPGAGARDPDG